MVQVKSTLKKGETMKKVKISDSELKIMEVLWNNSSLFSADIVKALNDTNWDPKTIHTFLRRLVSKGLVKAKKKGAFYEYSPLINRDEYIIKESKSFLDKVFNGSLSNMVYKFVNEGELSPEEIKKLRVVLDSIENYTTHSSDVSHENSNKDALDKN